MNSLEAISQHPWAAGALGTWVLLILVTALGALKESIAIIATVQRRPEPYWHALSRV